MTTILIDDLGYPEIIAITVGDSEADGFWHKFLESDKERGLDRTRLVFSKAHRELTASINRMFQGYCWQQYQVHFLRNLLSHVPKLART